MVRIMMGWRAVVLEAAHHFHPPPAADEKPVLEMVGFSMGSQHACSEASARTTWKQHAGGGVGWVVKEEEVAAQEDAGWCVVASARSKSSLVYHFFPVVWPSLKFMM